MDGHSDPRAPRLLRRLARLLIRGPDARFILNDLDELVARDLGRGISRPRALLRYGRNLLASAWRTWKTPEIRPVLRGISWLDVKLGARTLIKHPGLSLVGGFGMAVAMVIGVISFEIISNLLNSTLPVEDGERVVSLGYWDAETNLPERQLLHDYVAWREELKSVEAVGAFRDVSRNLALGEGPAAPVRGAEMTASGFRVLRTPPLLGRTLVSEDDREGAPPVVVIGHEVWQSRFAGAPDIVGRTVHLGATPHTVVGVMPEGFEFPMNHQFWAPLRADPSAYARGEGPALQVFGRLAPGVGLEEARAELTTIGRRAAAAHPETHGQLRARILPYTLDLFDLENPGSAWILRFGQLLVSLLLVVVCVNVAVLVYARTVARRGEIAVRSALGASRRRVVTQLFLEALMISAIAAVVGLVVAQAALGRIQAWVASVERVPYWIDLDLSAATVLYALGLAVLAAVIVGVLPALKATGGRLQSSLRELGGAGARLGRTWNVLIVSQVAIAVFILPMATLFVWESRPRFSEPGFPVDEILTAEVQLNAPSSAGGGAEDDPSELRARAGVRLTELMRRLEAEPGVAAVTFSSRLPGNGPQGEVELEGGTPTAEALADPDADYLRVGTGLFEAYGAELRAGRAFNARDAGGTATPVVVNRSFVQRFVGGGSPLGRRMRYTEMQQTLPLPEPEGTWYEIVGVVSDFPAYPPSGLGSPPATVYHPVAPGEIDRVLLSLRVQGAGPVSLIGRVREVATRVDPTLRVDEIRPLTDVYGDERFSVLMAVGTFALMTLSVLLLSGAGIYALTSFAVAQSTREIGIRIALGAPPRRILRSIFARALRQLVIAAGIGLLLGGGGLIASSDLDAGQTTVLLVATPAILLATGLLAALGPARRVLGIQPTEALREQ